MDWVRLGSICSIEFDWFGNRTHTDFGVRFRSIAELNRTQSTDWVRLSSILLLKLHNSEYGLSASAAHCVRLPNSIEHNLMDWVRLGSICSIEFDWFGNRTHTDFGVRFRSIAELNRTQSTDWVRLSSILLLKLHNSEYGLSASAAHCVRLPNFIEHNLMDWVRLGSICSIEFDWFGNRTHTDFGVRFRSIAELNRTQSTDWVRLSSISERSICYPGGTATKKNNPTLSNCLYRFEMASCTVPLERDGSFIPNRLIATYLCGAKNGKEVCMLQLKGNGRQSHWCFSATPSSPKFWTMQTFAYILTNPAALQNLRTFFAINKLTNIIIVPACVAHDQR